MSLYGLIIKDLNNIEKELYKYTASSNKDNPYTTFSSALSENESNIIKEAKIDFQKNINYITNLSNQLQFGIITEEELMKEIQKNNKLYINHNQGLDLKYNILDLDNIGNYILQNKGFYFKNRAFGKYINKDALWDSYIIGGKYDGEIIVNKDVKGLRAKNSPTLHKEIFLTKYGLKGVNAAKLKDINFEQISELKQKDKYFIDAIKKFYNIRYNSIYKEKTKVLEKQPTFNDILIDKSYISLNGVIIEDKHHNYHPRNNENNKDLLLRYQEKYPEYYLVIIDGES